MKMWADGEGMELDKQQVWWSGSLFDYVCLQIIAFGSKPAF